tara:strand:+ start:601 stop:951 length:351 start_codon:yes stop_codon:yes gene_type:complete
VEPNADEPNRSSRPISLNIYISDEWNHRSWQLDITVYLRESGHTALTLEAEYELLLTKKLILQPREEMALYGKGDSENGLGSGLAEASLRLRLRYEVTRQFAPGMVWRLWRYCRCS